MKKEETKSKKKVWLTGLREDTLERFALQSIERELLKSMKFPMLVTLLKRQTLTGGGLFENPYDKSNENVWAIDYFKQGLPETPIKYLI